MNIHAEMDLLSAGLGGLIAQSLEEQLCRWLRAAELTCDRAALLVAQDPKVLLSFNCISMYLRITMVHSVYDISVNYYV